MIANRLLTAAAAVALAAGASSLAWAQATPQTATTQGQAQAATGKPTTDAPATTQPQGTAAAVAQGTGAAPAAPAASPGAAGYRPIVASGDIVQTLQASGQFKTFIKALDATNLTAVLKSQPHLTVFAPTDAAFAAYGDTTKLFADLPGLQKLLLHHIINAEIDSTKYKNAHGPVASGAGDKVVLDGVTEQLKADQANIIQADVRASNGIIDVVDQVLKAGSVPEAPPAGASAPQDSQQATTTETKTESTTTKSSKGTKRRR